MLEDKNKSGFIVNDAQSKLNSTWMKRLLVPKDIKEIKDALVEAENEGLMISIAGGRHAMGGQQFVSEGLLLDMSHFNKVIHFDSKNGWIEVQSGIEWKELIEHIHKIKDSEIQWAIRQKQTGVDEVSIGGSISANIHGRGLKFSPFGSDIESFKLLNAKGDLLNCSRSENKELFSLVIGGYGLFGIITQVVLRLVPRQKVKRVVEIIKVKDLVQKFENRIQDGAIYGDCQYSIDLSSDWGEHKGVFSCYYNISNEIPVPRGQKRISKEKWSELYTLTRTDKAKAFDIYSKFYLTTNNQIYWSDTHQLSNVFDGYLESVDGNEATEMITELYITRDKLIPLLTEIKKDFLKNDVDVTYGTIRLIEKDDDSFLAWATEPMVCVVCNLHIKHSAEEIKKAKDNFQRMIDQVISFGGRFYLTYHRWVTRRQLESCYPQLKEFLKLKLKYDPHERFQSTWYQYFKELMEN
jgi:FAD/FMN-containing dehydrogenase